MKVLSIEEERLFKNLEINFRKRVQKRKEIWEEVNKNYLEKIYSKYCDVIDWEEFKNSLYNCSKTTNENWYYSR